MSRPLLYIAHPVRSRCMDDAEALHAAIAKALRLGWTPIAGVLLFRDHLNDAIAEEREMALACDLSLLAACNAFLIVGERVTEGMQKELDTWRVMSLVSRGRAPERVARWFEPEPFTVETLSHADRSKCAS